MEKRKKNFQENTTRNNEYPLKLTPMGGGNAVNLRTFNKKI